MTPKLKRQLHWATRSLHTYLLDHASAPFAWGTNDCCTFAADGIKEMTGVDIDDFRGTYTDELSAMASISKVTGIPSATIGDGMAYCANKYGLEEYQYPLMAQRGDLALIAESGRLIAGLMHLNGRHVVAQGEDGLKRILITPRNIVRAWKV